MKKKIADFMWWGALGLLAAAIVMLIGILLYKQFFFSLENRYYPLTTTVTEVNNDEDTVTIRDKIGHEWVFFGSENWREGDICSCIMDTMNTEENIFDDEIIRTKYDGHSTE